jgi:hypothetical protein
VRSWQDVDRVEFTAAGDHDADSHYEATLTATDAQGATSSQTFHIYPETSGLALRSDPPGAPLFYAGRVLRAPADLAAAIGFRTTISAAQSFSSGGREFRFRSWSDGGGRMHDVVIPPGGLSVLAAYDPVGGPHAAPAPGGGSGERRATRPDDRPPRLVLPGMRGVDAARGVLRGRVSDPSGVRRVEIALALRAGARCRWWNAGTRSLARGASCRRPRFVRARLQRVGNGRYRWRRDLQRPLTPGRWTLLLRAVDGAGNRASAAVGRPARISITVRNGRASIR